MPASSKQQQKFMGMVHALKKGDIKPSDVSQSVKDAAKSMSKKDAKDFASTPHKNLPRKVKQEILNKLKEYANKMGRDHLGGDDYTSKKKGGLRDFDGYDNVDYNKDMPMDESVNEVKVNYNFSEEELKRVLKLLGRNASTEVKMIKAFEKAFGRKLTRDELFESVNEAKFYITRNLGRGQGKALVGGYDLKRDKKLPPKVFKSYKDAEKEIKKLSRGGSIPGQMTAYFVTDKDMNMVDKNGKRKKMFEGMFSTIDQIRQDSKDVRDFVKNVFKDRDFAKMKNDKEFIKYLKSIYEGVDESKGVPQNYMSGRTSDYHTALRGKNRDYSGGTNFKKKHHGQPDIEKDDEDQETNHLSNKQTHVKSDKLKVSEGFDKVEHLSLLNQALRAIPGSQKQKEIIRKLNKVRKAGGMRPLKEQSIVEYGQRLDLSFIEDEEARLKGTPKPKDAIDRNMDESTINEIGIFPITNYMNGIIPANFVDTTTRDKKERLRSTLRDLKSTLNHFWKQHKIPYRIR
jgi:hypothetical protein